MLQNCNPVPIIQMIKIAPAKWKKMQLLFLKISFQIMLYFPDFSCSDSNVFLLIFTVIGALPKSWLLSCRYMFVKYIFRHLPEKSKASIRKASNTSVLEFDIYSICLLGYCYMMMLWKYKVWFPHVFWSLKQKINNLFTSLAIRQEFFVHSWLAL